MRPSLRPVWVEVDLSSIKHNVEQFLQIHSDKTLMAVVKAEAYGHGAIPVAKTALEAGARWLAVATPDEGIALRESGLQVPILVFGTLAPGQERAFAEHGLTATVGTVEAARAVTQMTQQGVEFPVHIKVDTGMGRVGLLPGEAETLAKAMVTQGVHLEGVYTHLATADAAELGFADRQLNVFAEVTAQLRAANIWPRWVHAGNSAAALRFTLAGLNMVRLGISMYGHYPSEHVSSSFPLKPALSWLTTAVAVRRLAAGSSVSYGRTYLTKKDTTIVTLPLGYADGYSRRLGNRIEVLIGGRRFPVVGVVTMDQCMVDVGDFPVQVGDEVVVLGRQGTEEITAEEIAAALGTINYEVLTAIGSRVPRVYPQHSTER